MSRLSGPRRSERGNALFLVLSVLVLLTALVVSFLSTVTTELNTSKNYAAGATAERLADSTVQLVAAKIMQATRSRAGVSLSPRAWASQPGMVRTYFENGNPATFYKLYSSSEMVIDGTGFSPASEAPPIDWDAPSRAGLYADLNSPVVSDSYVAFPIVDPRALSSIPAMSVQGFNYDPARIHGSVGPNAAAETQRLPMPVLWLYQLQDGSLLAPDLALSRDGTVVFSGSKPTQANPIVGRVAFWTDDETAKVNINTASVGVAWDVPFYQSDYERNDLSQRPPPIGEYQRYPGHPFTTSLGPVLQPWLPLPTAVTALNFSQLQSYYKINPKTNPNDGTKGGTANTNISSGGVVPPVIPKSDRLYSTVDELFYAPSLGADGNRDLNGTAALTPEVLQKTKFFLTASSRAPDINLFGRPRIGIWPLSVVPPPVAANLAKYRTPEDTLIASCTSLGLDNAGKPLPYYFQRTNPDSPTEDFAIPRNQALFRYLQAAMAAEIPGFGGNFVNKWNALTGGNGTAERDELITLIFDYIRGATNLSDPKLNPTRVTGGKPYTNPHEASYTGPEVKANLPRRPGIAVPTVSTAPDTGTPVKGAGRFGIFEQFLLIFYAVPTPTGTGAATQTAIQAYVVPVIHHPHLGMMRCWEVSRVEARVLSGQFQITGKGSATGGGTLSFFGGGIGHTLINRTARHGDSGRNFGGNHESFPITGQKNFSNNPSITKGDNNEYGLYAFNRPVVVGNPGDPAATWDFAGGTMQFTIKSWNGEVVQTYTVEFPDIAGLAIPGRFTVPASVPTPPNGGYISFNWSTGLGWARCSGPNNGKLFMGQDNSEGDIVRAVELTSGDFRLISSLTDVPASMFSPLPNYTDGTRRRIHNLRMGYGWNFTGALSGSLVPTSVLAAPATLQSYPFISPAINGVYIGDNPSNPIGDWNTGHGDRPDGAYMNKPDEGAALNNATGGGLAYYDYDGLEQAPNLTSPTRQMPSPVMLGSLPVGTRANPPISWLTPLFHPDCDGLAGPAKGGSVNPHPGAASPKDHLLLDLFTMPIAEPYAISEPLSTAGRVNMNYQIVPFGYITRNTGIRAVLAPERLPMIRNAFTKYKAGASAAEMSSPLNQRPFINLDETLKGFDDRFANGDIFRSATEICDLHMVPAIAGATYFDMPAFWSGYRRTGDNLKERPYLTIYPRLTTKSNTFTVHVRVQTLKKVPGTPIDEWVEQRDQVSGEYRGASTLERYVDPSNPSLPDFAADLSATIDDCYRFRIIQTKRFGL